MAIRALRSASAEHQDDLDYLLASLKADPQAAAIVSEPESASAALKAQTEAWNNRHLEVRQTQTGLGNLDEIMINVVRTAHSVILDDVHHNRRSLRFLTYFPRGLVAFTRASYIDQLTAVRALAQRCAGDSSPKVREQAGLLDAAAAEMDAAFVRRGEALVAESSAYGELQVKKVEAMEACRRVGYRLAELYPGERDRVRSYFRRTYRRPRPTSPTTGDPTPETGTAAAGKPAAATAAVEPAATGTVSKVAPVGPSLVLSPTTANL